MSKITRRIASLALAVAMLLTFGFGQSVFATESGTGSNPPNGFVAISIAEDAQSYTALFLPEGVATTNEALLAGVSAADENGEAVPVSVADTDGLDLQNPALRSGYAPYNISYTAAHPNDNAVTDTAMRVYVTVGIMPTATTHTWNSSTVPTVSDGDTITVQAGASDVLPEYREYIDYNRRQQCCGIYKLYPVCDRTHRRHDAESGKYHDKRK